MLILYRPIWRLRRIENGQWGPQKGLQYSTMGLARAMKMGGIASCSILYLVYTLKHVNFLIV